MHRMYCFHFVFEFLRLDAVVYIFIAKSMRRDDSRMKKKKKKKRYIKMGCTCVDENSLRGVNDECETAGWFNEDLN